MIHALLLLFPRSAEAACDLLTDRWVAHVTELASASALFVEAAASADPEFFIARVAGMPGVRTALICTLTPPTRVRVPCLIGSAHAPVLKALPPCPLRPSAGSPRKRVFRVLMPFCMVRLPALSCHLPLQWSDVKAFPSPSALTSVGCERGCTCTRMFAASTQRQVCT